MSEFDLIRQYFSRPAPSGYVGVGDDCALFSVDPGKQLATSTDMLIEGRHFLAGTDPVALGHKALAVNISDLAAMGAQPLGCLLGLSLPRVDEAWLAAFSDGFQSLATQAGCPLIGGDTTRSNGDIIISVTVFGQVEQGRALRRNNAQPGDDIWLTGSLGGAYAALQWLTGVWQRPDATTLEIARQILERPNPPWQFAQELIGLAHAALDISDGLLQDLGHILQASQCGAVLHYPKLPLDTVLASLNEAKKRAAVLSGGDVYQLCFTAAAQRKAQIKQLASRAGVQVSHIGIIQSEPGLHVLGAHGKDIVTTTQGFDHFQD